MKKPEDCTIEELIVEVHYWEDPAGVLIYSTETGGVWVNDYEGACGVGAATLKEALIEYGYSSKNRFRTWKPDKDSKVDWLARV